MKSIPNEAFSSINSLVEYSWQYTDGDGLLKAFYDPIFEVSVQKRMYLIALTTIWISLCTNPTAEKRPMDSYLEKARRDYQICLLYYCFGLLLGSIPSKGIRFAKCKGFTWSTFISGADEERCLEFAIDLMSHFGLQYSPSYEVSKK